MASLTELLLLGSLPLVGSLINRDEIERSNQASEAIQRRALDIATAPQFLPTGDIINVGAPPQLTPETQALVNRLRDVEIQGAETSIQRGDISQDLLSKFQTGFDEGAIRDEARAATDADRLFVEKSILEPALDKAAVIDRRVNRGSSNPNRTLEAVSRGAAPTLAQFGQTAGLNLGNQQVDQFIKNSLGLSVTTDPNRAQASFTQPEPFNAGQTANLADVVTRTGANVRTPNLALGQALGSSAALIQSSLSSQAADQRSNRLFDLFERTLGNQ